MENTQPKVENARFSSPFKQEKMYGLPIWAFAVLSVIILFAAYMGKLPTDYVGIIALLMVLGGAFFYIGSKIPILNEYIGLAVVLPLFGCSFLVYTKLFPGYLIKPVGDFMKGGFQNLYIAAILVGSILSLNRKTILRSVYKFLPTIVGSQIFAIGFLALAGVLTGVGAFQSIFMIGAPTMAGGSGGAIATLPAVYSSILKTDASKFAGPFLGYATIVNVMSILSAAVLSRVLANKKGIDGRGRILMEESAEDIMMEEKRPASDKDYAKLGAGLLLSLTFMVAGKLIAAVVPQIADLAWMIILAITVKAAGWLSDDFCDYAAYWMNFMLKNLLPLLIAGIGIASMDISVLPKYFTLQAFFIMFMGVFGAVIGAALIGRLFRLWPLESAISVAFCCCDIGASGDIAILSATNRMQLLPFSSISTRIGGALMVLEISLLLPLFVK